jgi:hypothetical protein
MKKILLALLILGAGAIAFARLNLLASQSRAAATHSRADCALLASQADELAASANGLRAQVAAKKTRLAEIPPPPASSPDTAGAPAGGASHSSRRPKPGDVLRRLGFGWNSSADYVLLSKAALNRIYLQGIDHNGAFTPAACAVLGLTPAERATVEAALKRAEAEHAAWLKTALQRVEPAGDILADYRLPANPKLAQQIEDEGTSLLAETLGPDRAKLVHDYAGAWLHGHATLGATSVRLTIRRRTQGTEPVLWFQQEQEGGNISCYDIGPGSFPDLLRSTFPGGWHDLAQREGFTLPPEFQ